ncbi:DUF7677 family protein [Streptomyces sp. NBC_00566]|uniref:DUF7677 family protein n=1 Tax=Streptomyces sp. NBC_00566 TaxID=2975778 RepID=UPI003FCC8888
MTKGLSRNHPRHSQRGVSIFADVIELDDQGQPVNAKHTGRRTAARLYRLTAGR